MVLFLFINQMHAVSQRYTHLSNSDGCKCYVDGRAVYPGTKSCVGGSEAICIAKKGVGDEAKECGWDYKKDKDGNNIKCTK